MFANHYHTQSAHSTSSVGVWMIVKCAYVTRQLFRCRRWPRKRIRGYSRRILLRLSAIMLVACFDKSESNRHIWSHRKLAVCVDSQSGWAGTHTASAPLLSIHAKWCYYVFAVYHQTCYYSLAIDILSRAKIHRESSDHTIFIAADPTHARWHHLNFGRHQARRPRIENTGTKFIFHEKPACDHQHSIAIGYMMHMS